ncbi:MAG TPA: ATP-binding protein [Candidatus Paceibacterota bacterium]|nr:ATP-binding protein [Candidatus Paceibacterota bacterium]
MRGLSAHRFAYITVAIIALSVLALGARYLVFSDYVVIVEEGTTDARSAKMMMAEDALVCEWDYTPIFFLVSDNVFSPLIYYSHIFPIVGGAILAFLIWRQRGAELLNRLFVALSVFFITWCIFDLILWAHANPDYIMFFWSAQIYLDVLIYLFAVYLFYVFSFKKDLSDRSKLFGLAILLPVIALAPTELTLTAFDYTNCDREALEGPLWYYAYIIELFLTGVLIALAVRAYVNEKSHGRRVQTTLLATGLALFLLAFSWGNIVGSLSEDWSLAQYGLFGMPVFLAIVTYLIVQFQVFRVKVIATSALVTALWVLLFSVLLFESIQAARSVIVLTLLFFAIMGFLLVRSVRREIEQRELIERQEKELEIANRQQESLLHFISHEVKGYLTDGQNAFAAIIEGDLGATPPKMREVSQQALVKMRQGVRTVMEILDASNLKLGTVSYKKQPFDFKSAVEEAVEHLRPRAAEKQLQLDLSIDATKKYSLVGDKEKITQHVVRNLIDNAIRYTPKGNIHVTLVRTDRAVRMSVKDTGVGITDEDKKRLFTQGGHGKESIKVNVDSTGYGLFVAKQVVEAHGGSIRAESAGAGKGSEFIVELPVT